MAFFLARPKRSVHEDLQIMAAMAQGEIPAAPRSPKIRTRLHTLGAILGAVGVFVGIGTTRNRQAGAATVETEQRLAGTWALQTVGGAAIGPHFTSDLLLQRVTFANGIARGETRLRANTASGTTDMPFPDESAKGAVTSADGRYLDVAWEGTYTVLDSRRIELHIGKAVYRVEAKFDSAFRSLEFDHDAILTLPGAAAYRRE